MTEKRQRRAKPTLIAELTKKAYERNGFIDALIFGDKGSGKSVYALISAYQVYGDWDQALDHIFFDPLDALETMMKAYFNDERVKLLILDDAGLWLGKLGWWEHGKVKFSELYNVIREVCSCVVFTSPTDDIVSRVEKQIKLRLKVEIVNETESVVKIYKKKLTPLFQEIVKTLKWEYFERYIPDEVYKRYVKLKRGATKKKLIEFKQTLENARKQEEVVQNIIKELCIYVVTSNICNLDLLGVSKITDSGKMHVPLVVRNYGFDKLVWFVLKNGVEFPIGIPEPYIDAFKEIFMKININDINLSEDVDSLAKKIAIALKEKIGGDSSSASTTY